MAFSASHVEITLRYENMGQLCQTARQYTWDGAAIAAASASQLGEGWWNHYKAAWRALLPSGAGNGQFLSVLVREIGGSLTYGEYAIPPGEVMGSRAAGGLGSQMPSFTSVGCRLTVGSAVTRPGQMRIPFINEADSNGQSVEAAFLTLCATLAALYSSSNILGAPVATGVLFPRVVRFGASNDVIEESQSITGYVLNTFTTSQVSRRKGHGS